MVQQATNPPVTQTALALQNYLDGIRDLPVVEALYTWNDGTSTHLVTVINTDIRQEEYAVYHQQQRTIERYPTAALSFRVLNRHYFDAEVPIEELLHPHAQTLFSR